jgi:hypothetical protein
VKTSTRCCRDAELRKRFAEFGPEPLATALGRLGEPTASEIEKSARVVADARIEKQ